MKVVGRLLSYLMQYVTWSLLMCILLFSFTKDREAELMLMFVFIVFLVVAVANLVYYEVQLKRYTKPYRERGQ